MADHEHTLYEGLFLMGQQAGRDAAGAREVVQQMLDRAEAEVLTVHKWDDRRLAYPIKGQKRGMFILALFRVAGVQIANIERDCNLSEDVTRVLITRGDHLGEPEIGTITGQAEQAAAAEALREEQAEQDQEGEEAGQGANPTQATGSEQEAGGEASAGEGGASVGETEASEPRAEASTA